MIADEIDVDGADAAAPVWAVFGDLMSGLLGAFVLILLFAFNSAELQPEGLALLRQLAGPVTTYLKARDEILMVSGFTDDRQVRGGNHQFADNWELSAQRSLTVTRALIEAGVPSSDIFAAAFGSEQPVADNAGAEGRARNRRVEMAPTPRPARANAAGSAASAASGAHA